VKRGEEIPLGFFFAQHWLRKIRQGGGKNLAGLMHDGHSKKATVSGKARLWTVLVTLKGISGWGGISAKKNKKKGEDLLQKDDGQRGEKKPVK